MFIVLSIFFMFLFCFTLLRILPDMFIVLFNLSAVSQYWLWIAVVDIYYSLIRIVWFCFLFFCCCLYIWIPWRRESRNYNYNHTFIVRYYSRYETINDAGDNREDRNRILDTWGSGPPEIPEKLWLGCVGVTRQIHVFSCLAAAAVAEATVSPALLQSSGKWCGMVVSGMGV